MEKYVKINLFTLELGTALCSDKTLDDIFKVMPVIKKEIFNNYGVVIPNIRVKENKNLNPLEYAVKIDEVKIGGFEFKKNSIMIIDTGCVKSEIKGKPTKEPAFGCPALWITKSRKAEAVDLGYVALSPERVIKAHFSEIIKKNLSSVITTQYVSELMDEVLKEDDFLCSMVVKKYGSSSIIVVKKVLSSLLAEGVSIRNIVPILETIADEEKVSRKQIQYLVNMDRCSIAPSIVDSLVNDKKELYVLMVSEELSKYLYDYITEEGEIALEPVMRNWLYREVTKKIGAVTDKGGVPVVLCWSPIRFGMRRLFDTDRLTELHCISDKELVNATRKINCTIEVVDTIGKDFVAPAANESEKSDKSKAATQEKSKSQNISKDDYAKLQKGLESILANLDEFEQKVISMRFGLGEEHSHTLEEVGNAFDISREQIRMIEAKALRLLRKNVSSDE